LIPFRWAWSLVKIAFGLFLCVLVVAGLVKALSRPRHVPSPIERRPSKVHEPKEVQSVSTLRGQRYIQLASEANEADANARAALEATKQTAAAEVCVFASPTAFGIALGPLTKNEATSKLSSLKKQGTIPGDAILAAAHHQMRTCYPTAPGAPL
jgi:hypothetical protein